jgi:nitroreductase
MMTAAAFEGVDSCPIEGMEKEKVEEILGVDTGKYQVAVLTAMGYRTNPQSEQIRRPFEEVVEFLD